MSLKLDKLETDFLAYLFSLFHSPGIPVWLLHSAALSSSAHSLRVSQLFNFRLPSPDEAGIVF